MICSAQNLNTERGCNAMAIKVSIIVPIYNVEKYLDRCLKSLLLQTLKEIEIILVDDCSPDHCPQMCDEYAKKDSRIKVVHKQNGGLGFARNSGLEIATGEYVAFVDSDDYVDKSMYETLWNEAVKSKADAVFCGFKTEQQKSIWTDSDEVAARTVWEGDEVKDFMLDMIASAPHVKEERKYQMSVWHGIYRRSTIEENHIRFHSERDIVSEDLPFQVDFLLKINKLVYIPQSFYYYCLNGTSLTATFKSEKYEGFKRLYLLLNSQLEDIVGYKHRTDRFFIGYVRSFFAHLFVSDYESKRLLVSKICNDVVWDVIRKDYSSSYLSAYPRIVYLLILWKKPSMLAIFCRFINYMKRRKEDLGGPLSIQLDLQRYDNHAPTLRDWILHNEVWYIFHYIRHLRYVEYYKDKNLLLYLWHFFRYKRLGFKLRMTIYPGTVGPGFRIYHAGDFVHVGPNVRIGKNCTMLPGVVFGNKTEEATHEIVTVGDNCYFGLGVKIFGGVTIGDNVTIGAMSVVTHDIPDNAVVAGIPARVIKYKTI